MVTALAIRGRGGRLCEVAFEAARKTVLTNDWPGDVREISGYSHVGVMRPLYVLYVWMCSDNLLLECLRETSTDISSATSSPRSALPGVSQTQNRIVGVV